MILKVKEFLSCIYITVLFSIFSLCRNRWKHDFYHKCIQTDHSITANLWLSSEWKFWDLGVLYMKYFLYQKQNCQVCHCVHNLVREQLTVFSSVKLTSDKFHSSPMKSTFCVLFSCSLLHFLNVCKMVIFWFWFLSFPISLNYTCN